jgi:hypothetical protein
MGEEPADMGMNEIDRTACANTRRMRVASAIGILMVSTVVGHPSDQWSLHGERTGDGQHSSDPSGAFETQMSEESVISDTDSESGERI